MSMLIYVYKYIYIYICTLLLIVPEKYLSYVQEFMCFTISYFHINGDMLDGVACTWSFGSKGPYACEGVRASEHVAGVFVRTGEHVAGCPHQRTFSEILPSHQ